MNDTEVKNETWKTIVIILILSVLSVACIEFGRSLNRKNEKQISTKVNNQWLEELDSRGLIIRNDKGGFTWRKK